MKLETNALNPAENDGFVAEVRMEWRKLQFAVADEDACGELCAQKVLPSWFSSEVEHEKVIDWHTEGDEPEMFVVLFKDAGRAEQFAGDLRKLLKERANHYDAVRTKAQARRAALNSAIERIQALQVDCDKLGIKTFSKAQSGLHEAEEQLLGELDKLVWLDARAF